MATTHLGPAYSLFFFFLFVTPDLMSFASGEHQMGRYPVMSTEASSGYCEGQRKYRCHTVML